MAATFSEALDPTTVTAANFTLATGPATGRTVAGTLSYDAKTSTVIFVPAASLASYTTYTVLVGGITDLSGNPMSPTSWTFTTGGGADSTPPTVTAVVPASGATRVSVVAVVSLTFSEPVDPTTLAAGIQVAAGVTPVAGSVTCDTANQSGYLHPVGRPGQPDSLHGHGGRRDRPGGQQHDGGVHLDFHHGQGAFLRLV